MTEKNSRDRKPLRDGQDSSVDTPPKGRKFSPALLVFVVAIIAGAMAGAYKIGLFESLVRSTGITGFGEKLDPVFTRPPEGDVLSSGNLLAGVGKIPAGDAGVAPRVPLEPLPLQGPLDKTPPASGISDGANQGKLHQPRVGEKAPKEPSAPDDSPAKTPVGPRPVETSVITPGQGDPSPSKETATSLAVKKETPDWEEATRSEQFRLPGSLLVKIHNYSGTQVNWGIAVIFDDSGTMARQSKIWNPSRLKSGADFLGKLPGVLTPNSKLVVRDFFCGKSGDTDKKAPCSSHILLEWSGYPFKQLKELLEQTHPGGQTDPCAAAAYAAKNDFKGQGNLTPRILIVTDGTSKCASNTVLKAVEVHESKERVAVDVLALGMSKKRHRGYTLLANKTNGLLLDVDKPTDIDQALSRYGKVLKAKVMEKVEVKGDKAVTSVSPFQEIALAPGTYTVILPLVEALNPSKRTITGVKINPGETNVLEVTIRKGQPIVRAGRK